MIAVDPSPERESDCRLPNLVLPMVSLEARSRQSMGDARPCLELELESKANFL